MSKMSVIIPAYNAVSTLEHTVRSVLAQTLNDIDIIIVNDGSNDGTAELCDCLSTVDSRIRVIHQSNSGCYQARLNALRTISSLYFGFVDADDTIDPNMYADMVRVAEEENLDVVKCNIYSENVGNGQIQILDNRNDVMNGYIIPKIIKGEGAAFVWDKIYRNQYDFESFDETDHVTMSEDMIFNLQFFLKVNRMGLISKPYYHYNVNAGSSVRNFNVKYLHDFYETVRVRELLLPSYGYSKDSIENIKWIKKNMRNQLISAIAAPSKNWSDWMDKVRAVIHCSLFPYKWMRIFPESLVACLGYLLKRLHG